MGFVTLSEEARVWNERTYFPTPIVRNTPSVSEHGDNEPRPPCQLFPRPPPLFDYQQRRHFSTLRSLNVSSSKTL